MNSKRLELFIIAILICINVCFFLIYDEQKKNDGYVSESAASDACRILEKRGVIIERDVMLTSLRKYRILSYEQTPSVYDEVSQAFLGDDATSFVLPGGIAYIGGEGYVEITDKTDFTYRDLSVFPLPVDDVSERPDLKKRFDALLAKASELASLPDSIESANGAQRSDDDLPSISSLRFGGKDMSQFFSEARPVNSEYFDGFRFIIFVQSKDGIDVCTSRLVLVADQSGRVVLARGKYVFSKPASRYDADMYDGANILFFVPADSGRVTAMRLAYYSVFYSDTGFYMIPAYVITFGDGRMLYIDAVSGYIRNQA